MMTYAEQQQYDTLTKFESLKEFNDHFEQMMIQVKDQFTKSEYIALNKLRKYAGSDIVGVAWAKLQKVVASTWADAIGVSRRTFDRMLAKARKLNVVSVLNQKRKNGAQKHNVYVFNRVEELVLAAVEVVEIVSKSDTIDVPLAIDAPRTNILLELPEIKIKEKDNTYATQSTNVVPDNIDIDLEIKEQTPYERFKAYVSNFITERNVASKLYGIYRAHTCKLVKAPDLDIAVEAFKQTISKYKQGKVKSITGYFNGTLSNMVDKYMLDQMFGARQEVEVEFELDETDLPWGDETVDSSITKDCARILADEWGITEAM